MTITSTAPLYASLYGTPYTSAMAKRKILGVQVARQQFAERLDAADQRGEHTILFRRSTPVAVLVPAEWYHRASELLGDPWEDWTPPEKTSEA